MELGSVVNVRYNFFRPGNLPGRFFCHKKNIFPPTSRTSLASSLLLYTYYTRSCRQPFRCKNLHPNPFYTYGYATPIPAIGALCSYGEFPIDSSLPKSKDNSLELTIAGLGVLKILLMGVLPGLLLVGGTILLIRRKRK